MIGFVQAALKPFTGKIPVVLTMTRVNVKSGFVKPVVHFAQMTQQHSNKGETVMANGRKRAK